jgi:hypothetical protein
MKNVSFFLVLLVGFGLCGGCKKSNQPSSLAGTHFFSGTADYVFPGFASFPAAQLLDQSDTFTTVITKSESPDSADYYYLPATTIDPGPLGGIYLVFTTTVESQSGATVAIHLADTLITIPPQFPWSGGDLNIHGDGSFVNNKITLRYQSEYRLYSKYDTAVSVKH